MAEVVAAALRGGVDLVQLRVHEPQYGHDEVLEIALALRSVTENRALLFINGYPDIAARSGADGVHLPETDDSIDRSRLRARLLIGRSVHSAAAAERARRAGADLLVAGAMFPTGSHPGRAAAGLGLIKEIRVAGTAPVIGIGGVDHSNAAAVMAAGADGIAVIGAIWASPDPEAAARRLRGIIDGGEVRA